MHVESLNIKPTYAPLREVRVTFANGDIMFTNMASGVTDAEILEYYKPGRYFNLGLNGGVEDNMVAVSEVKILK